MSYPMWWESRHGFGQKFSKSPTMQNSSESVGDIVGEIEIGEKEKEMSRRMSEKFITDCDK